MNSLLCPIGQQLNQRYQIALNVYYIKVERIPFLVMEIKILIGSLSVKHQVKMRIYKENPLYLLLLLTMNRPRVPVTNVISIFTESEFSVDLVIWTFISVETAESLILGEFISPPVGTQFSATLTIETFESIPTAKSLMSGKFMSLTKFVTAVDEISTASQRSARPLPDTLSSYKCVSCNIIFCRENISLWLSKTFQLSKNWKNWA